MSIPRPNDFVPRVIAWQRVHGRHHLPWQSRNPYHVWLSEVMLQQTQVSTVMNYFTRFIQAIPSVEALATANTDEVLSLWSGLGYYSRARNLQHAAKQIMHEFDGEFPQTRAELETLKGVGRSTAAAIAVFAFGKREAILDGNVKRVFIRHRAIDAQPNHPQTLRTLWLLAEDLLHNDAPANAPANGPTNGSESASDKTLDLRAYTQGLMDLGSLICTRSKPKCELCPVQTDCQALALSLTDALPRKKAKQVKPVKQTVMLILRHNEQLYLQRRPDEGIWRSLWSFPQFDTVEEARNHANAMGSIQTTTELENIKHTFSHYHLIITPLLVELSAKNSAEHFLSINDALSKGLPKPTRHLIENLSR